MNLESIIQALKKKATAPLQNNRSSNPIPFNSPIKAKGISTPTSQSRQQFYSNVIAPTVNTYKNLGKTVVGLADPRRQYTTPLAFPKAIFKEGTGPAVKSAVTTAGLLSGPKTLLSTALLSGGIGGITGGKEGLQKGIGDAPLWAGLAKGIWGPGEKLGQTLGPKSVKAFQSVTGKTLSPMVKKLSAPTIAELSQAAGYTGYKKLAGEKTDFKSDLLYGSIMRGGFGGAGVLLKGNIDSNIRLSEKDRLISEAYMRVQKAIPILRKKTKTINDEYEQANVEKVIREVHQEIFKVSKKVKKQVSLQDMIDDINDIYNKKVVAKLEASEGFKMGLVDDASGIKGADKPFRFSMPEVDDFNKAYPVYSGSGYNPDMTKAQADEVITKLFNKAYPGVTPPQNPKTVLTALQKIVNRGGLGMGDNPVGIAPSATKDSIAAMNRAYQEGNIQLGDQIKKAIAEKKPSIEAGLEKATGWAQGDKVKFDTALFKKDAKTIEEMLPKVPEEYKQRFAKEISLLVQKKQIADKVSKGLTPQMKAGITAQNQAQDMINAEKGVGSFGLSTKAVKTIKQTQEQAQQTSQTKIPQGLRQGFVQDSGTPPSSTSQGGSIPDSKQIGKQRGLLETLSESPKSTKVAKETVKSIDNQTYDPLINKKTFDDAQLQVAKNPDGIYTRIFSDEPVSADKTASAIALMKKYEKEGNIKALREVFDEYDKQLRKAGQGIQAVTLWNKLSPTTVYKHIKQIADEKGIVFSDDVKDNIISAMARINKMPPGKEKSLKTVELLNYVAEKMPLSKGEIFESYRYQNMLSNPRTHERNIYSNLLQTFVKRPIDIAFEGTYDILRHPLNPMARDVSLSNVPRYYKNAFTSLPNAIHAAKESFKQGFNSEKLDLNNTGSTLESLRRAKTPYIFSVVPRFLEAQDKFFSTLIASGEYNNLIRKGVDDDIAKKKSREIAERYLFREKLGKTAKTDPTFVKALDSLGSLALQGRKLPVVGKPYSWFVPFITTPINVAKEMVRSSPLGFIGGSYSREQIAQATAGSIITFAGAHMAINDNTTWGVPVDPKAKELFYAAGKKPYSIRIGDKWVPMYYLGPFSLAVALPAALKHYNEDAKTSLSDDDIAKIGRATSDIGRYITSQTPLSGVAGFYRLLEGDADTNMSSLLGYTAGQAIPLQGMIRYINSIIDPVYRKARGFKDTIIKDIPGLSQNLPSYRTPEGEESKRLPINYVLPYDVGQIDNKYEEKYEHREGVLQFNNTYNKQNKIYNEISSGNYQFIDKDDPKMSAIAVFRHLNNANEEERQTEYEKIKQYITPEIKEKIVDLVKLQEKGYNLEDVKILLIPQELRARAIVDRLSGLNKENRQKKYNQLKKDGVITEEIQSAMSKIIADEYK